VTQPRRVLLVSATIGEGHNATARAVEEAVRRLWPECTVSWVDALDVMGRWVPPAFRWIYVVNVENTPWLYNFFYSALWRYHWFAHSCRRFVGAWSGRRLRGVVQAEQPDLVVSTYPLGTAGLDWLRRHDALDVTAAAVISDFSPHPFWVYPEIDQHYVMSDASLREMHRAVPSAVGGVCVPPVVSAFRPRDKTEARRARGLSPDEFVVLISCGSLGFGSIDRAVEASLRVAEVGRVVVACGRNESVRRRLSERAERDARLVPLGWVDDMPLLTSCADVVVTNAGGATALEALAAGRTVVMFEPIAGHGRANAELMAHAELAELCLRADDLTSTLQRLARDPDELATTEQRALRHARSADFTAQVGALARLPRHRVRRPLRPQDAFFSYTVTAAVPQHTGAVLRMDGGRPGMTIDDWQKHLSDLITLRAPHLPMLHSRLVRRRGRRPVWVPVERVDPDEHLHCQEIHGEPDHGRAVHEFFTKPVSTARPPWELLLLRDPDTQSLSLLAKLHQALGDGVSVTNTLLHLVRDTDEPVPVPHRRSRPGTRTPLLPRTRETLRGLLSLIAAGFAPAGGIRGRSTAARWFGCAELPARAVRAGARAHHVSSTVLLLTVVAEALHRQLHGRSGTSSGQRFRVMVPQRAANTDNGALSGNHTVTLSVDLPIGPMSAVDRVEAVAARVAAAREHGQPAAAGAVMAALGRLPAPVHRWVARRVYQRRFFSGIVSVMPGLRRLPSTADATIATVIPILPLADGVGLAVGAISWGDALGLGITVDPGLVDDPAGLLDGARAAFRELAAEVEHDAGRQP
jgi:diacylglycerol O-acyltransferase / wax synthase